MWDDSNTTVERPRNRLKKEADVSDLVVPFLMKCSQRGKEYSELLERISNLSDGGVESMTVTEIGQLRLGLCMSSNQEDPASSPWLKTQTFIRPCRSKSRMVKHPPVGYNSGEGWDDGIGVILEYPGGEDKGRRGQIQSIFSKSSTSDIEQELH